MDGFRLVYQVLESDDGEVDVVITVIMVDRREDVYEALKSKLVKD
jgi:mRNA interferase RelE/StbE